MAQFPAGPGVTSPIELASLSSSALWSMLDDYEHRVSAAGFSRARIWFRNRLAMAVVGAAVVGMPLVVYDQLHGAVGIASATATFLGITVALALSGARRIIRRCDDEERAAADELAQLRSQLAEITDEVLRRRAA